MILTLARSRKAARLTTCIFQPISLHTLLYLALINLVLFCSSFLETKNKITLCSGWNQIILTSIIIKKKLSNKLTQNFLISFISSGAPYLITQLYFIHGDSKSRKIQAPALTRHHSRYGACWRENIHWVRGIFGYLQLICYWTRGQLYFSPFSEVSKFLSFEVVYSFF